MQASNGSGGRAQHLRQPGADFPAAFPISAHPSILCDTPAIRILGLSLAGWNAVISLGLALVALAGLRSQGSSSVSQ